MKHMAIIHKAEDGSYTLVAALKQHLRDCNTYQFQLRQHISDTRPSWTPREILDIGISREGLITLRDLLNIELEKTDDFI